jgi:hypothetical protein
MSPAVSGIQPGCEMEVVMTNSEIRRYQMLVRVRDFGAAHRELFSKSSVAGKLFAIVADAADAVQRHETTELAGRGGEQKGATSKAEARLTLRRRVAAIANTARACEEQGLADQFRATVSCSDARLVSQARTFLEEAKPFVKTFVAHELPSNFLSELREAIEAFEQASGERTSARDRRIGAQARIGAIMETALGAVRRLNRIVPNRLQDPAAIALWTGARRVQYGRVKADATAPEAPDAAKPAA